MKKLALVLLSLFVLIANCTVVFAVEVEGEFTYINDTEREYFDLKSGKDASENVLEWGVWEADNQYKGDQTFAYGYPQGQTEAEEGWTMPTLTFAFKGTYVGIISVAGDDQGWMDIYLDGEYVTTVRSHSSEAVDPYPVWDDAISLLIWEEDGLADAQHILTIQPTNQLDDIVNWSKCNVDAIVIKGEPIKVEDVDPHATVPPKPTPSPTPNPTPTLEETPSPSQGNSESLAPSASSTTTPQPTSVEKKDFPWIIVIVAALVVVGAGVFFLVTKKKK